MPPISICGLTSSPAASLRIVDGYAPLRPVSSFEIVSRATPLLSANSSWLITAPCRMRRKRGRSILQTSKTLQKPCIKPTTMLRYLEYSVLSGIRGSLVMSLDPRLVVPYVTEQSPRGERTMDIYSRLLADRIIFIGMPVDDQIANVVMAQLLHLDSEDPEQDINLYINSPGGSVHAGMAIYDTMQYVNADVATTALGMAASMGSFLLTAGAKGKRSALPNARILLHQPHIGGGLGGQVSDVEIHARELVRTKKRMNELYSQMTGQPIEKIERDTDRDYMLGPEEALEYGVIDRVVNRLQEGVIAAGG